MIKKNKLKPCLILIFILFVSVVITAGDAFAVWYSSNWGFRQKITIDSSMVPGDLSNFPVLVSVTNTNLIVSPGGNVGKLNGGDILFTSSNGTIKLDHEIESYNNATGELVAWVEVQNISSTADTEFYMYYGNAGAADQWNVNGTWDSNFLTVQHLEETSGTLFDSTSNSNNGTPEGTVECNISGKINGDCNFDAGNERARFDMSLGSTVTIAAWAQLDIQGDMLWTIDDVAGGPDLWFTNNNIYLNIWDGFTNPFCSQPANVNQWHHYAAVIEPGNTRLYVDGSLCGTANYRNPAETVIFIGSSSTAYTWDGRVDEFRISNLARTPDWIVTSFNNQDDPSLFMSFGVQEIFVPAPTMSEWGMTIFMGFAGLISIYYLRRKGVV